MSGPGRVKEPGTGSPVLIFALLGLVVSTVLVVWTSLSVAGGQRIPGNPFAAVIDLVRGTLAWSVTASCVAAAMIVAIVMVCGTTAWVWLRRMSRATRVDTAQQHLGRGKDIASICEPAIKAKSRSLNTVFPADQPWASPGVPIGATFGGTRLFGSFEDMHVDIHGPRMGKSTARVIPAICEAPGAVLATENKRGNLDHTRGVRESLGRRVWVFDPQDVANEEPYFYWDPLSYVVDEDTAMSLAELFADGEDGTTAKKDPYFDPEGQDLTANLLLASALAAEPITTVYERLAQRDRCYEAIDILTNDYPMIARALSARMALAPKQQDGIFGTALKMVQCLRSRKIQPWITTHDGDTRPHINLAQVVRGGETLYCLSREGVGSAGPIVCALTVATCQAAEAIATSSPGGRLPTPMLCALDEAANVVRWRRLPDLYSHYGSRGINIMTILQSWSQGVNVWGADGMRQLMGASNVFVYGGGSKETEFLEMLSKIIGDYERTAVNVSRGRGTGQSASMSTVKQRTLEVSDLGSWPRGRLLVFSAGNRPTIAKAVPWMDRPYAAAIEQSLRDYQPIAEKAAVSHG